MNEVPGRWELPQHDHMVDEFRRWLADQDNVAASTARVYVRSVARMVKSRRTPNGWLMSEVAAGKPTATLTPIRAALVLFARFLADKRGVQVEPITPIQQIQRGRQREQPMRRDALTKEQLADYERLVLEDTQMPHAVRALLLLLPLTGLRVGEACTLRTSAFERREGRLGLTVVGKGAKTRWVPLTVRAAKILELYQRAVPPSGEVLFVIRMAGLAAPLQPDVVRDHLRRVRRKAPWSDQVNLTPHVLRHTYASRLYDRGVDIKVIQTLLGHEDIGTTARYTHPGAAKLSDEVLRVIE